MKRIYLTLLALGLTIPAFAQNRMVIHKDDGTKQFHYLATIDSLTFDTLMVEVGGRSFTAGSTSVTISTFNMDKYEVTYELWTAVRTWALSNGYTDMPAGQNGSNPIGSHHPVTTVSWYEAARWCNARSEKEGLDPVYYTDGTKNTVWRTAGWDINPDAVDWTANGYRLPTECEWEFAASGGTLTHGYTYSGSNTAGDVAWYNANSGTRTHSVGTKSANELGLFDMSGNVLEWCWDWHSASYPTVTATDPRGPITAQTNRIERGGPFYDDASVCSVTYRNYTAPSQSWYFLGFRCVQK